MRRPHIGPIEPLRRQSAKDPVAQEIGISRIVDMLELAPRCDHMVLFSGDGDFRCLVEALQRKGVRVTVV